MALRLGLIGGGNISDTHARAALTIPDVELAAVCSRGVERARALTSRYGGTPYADFDAFLAHRMDAVVIGSPSGLHAAHGAAAAERGLHVLVEKPIDVTIEAADSLIARCETAGVRLGVIFQDRTAPDLLWLRTLIGSGALGRVTMASAQVRWYRTPEYYAASSWRGTRDLDGGGAVINQGIHTLDLLLWLVGDVARVHAASRTAVHDIETEDTATACLEFASGAIGTYEAATSAYPGMPRRLEISGTDGTVIVENDRVVSARLRQPREDIPAARPDSESQRAASAVVSDVTGHRRVLENFVAAIRTGAPLVCDGRDGRRSLALVEAMYQSARSGAATQPATSSPRA